jgi:hypothetical protein
LLQTVKFSFNLPQDDAIKSTGFDTNWQAVDTINFNNSQFLNLQYLYRNLKILGGDDLIKKQTDSDKIMFIIFNLNPSKKNFFFLLSKAASFKV